MEPFPQKPDEAYRLYNLGVAYEARGYTSASEGDPKAAKKFFEEAAINYGKAIDDKPEEKYFFEPQNRIETALAHYKKLESIAAAEIAPAPAPPAAPPVPPTTPAAANPPVKTTARTSSTASTSGAPATPPTAAAPPVKTAARTSAAPSTTAAPVKTAARTSTPPAPSAAPVKPVSHTPSSEPPLTNDQVVQLFKAGLDEENLIVTIQQAKAVQFDFSVNGLVKLSQNGVKGRVLTAMRQRAQKP